jgi:hypothetical protein
MSRTQCNLWVTDEDDLNTVARIVVRWLHYERGEVRILPQGALASWKKLCDKLSEAIQESKRSDEELDISFIAPSLLVRIADASGSQQVDLKPNTATAAIGLAMH